MSTAILIDDDIAADITDGQRSRAVLRHVNPSAHSDHRHTARAVGESQIAAHVPNLDAAGTVVDLKIAGDTDDLDGT